MPTTARQLKEAAAKTAPPTPRARAQRLGCLIGLAITEAGLNLFPHLLSRTDPDPDQYGEVVSTFDANVAGRGLVTYYRVRSAQDVASAGADAYPSLALTLSDIRASYVVLPT